MMNYVGLGFDGDLLHSKNCLAQYTLSFYWILASVSTNGLVDDMIPSNWKEVCEPELSILGEGLHL